MLGSQNELSRVLYPVFVHCFLDLIEKNCVELAREFLEKYLPDHERLHGAEIKMMSGLGAPEHVEGNEQAEIFRKNKFYVKLCPYSFDLLLRFLHGYDFMLLLSIINERIVVNVRPQHMHTYNHTSSMSTSSLTYALNTRTLVSTHHQ
jgi:transcription initiation factor TFIID subunit 5